MPVDNNNNQQPQQTQHQSFIGKHNAARSQSKVSTPMSATTTANQANNFPNSPSTNNRSQTITGFMSRSSTKDTAVKKGPVEPLEGVYLGAIYFHNGEGGNLSILMDTQTDMIPTTSIVDKSVARWFSQQLAPRNSMETISDHNDWYNWVLQFGSNPSHFSAMTRVITESRHAKKAMPRLRRSFVKAASSIMTTLNVESIGLGLLYDQPVLLPNGYGVILLCMQEVADKNTIPTVNGLKWTDLNEIETKVRSRRRSKTQQWREKDCVAIKHFFFCN